jgi:hypothetical protein
MRAVQFEDVIGRDFLCYQISPATLRTKSDLTLLHRYSFQKLILLGPYGRAPLNRQKLTCTVAGINLPRTGDFLLRI